MPSLADLKLELRSCNKCPQRVTARHMALPLGRKVAEVFIVLPHPTFEDDKEGLIGMGFEGQFLFKHLALQGLGPSKVYLTSLIKCFPGWIRGKGYKKVSTQATDTCPPAYLLDELMEVNPKLIVVCGAEVARYFGLKGGINKMSGQVFDTEYGKVMPLTHPSRLLSQARMIPIFVTQLRLISLFLNDQLVGEAPPFDPEGWKLDTSGIYGVDIETDRPEGEEDWNKGVLWSIGYGDAVGRTANRNLEPFAFPGRPGFHNAGFDREQLERVGFTFPNGHHDSILSSHLLGYKPLGLKKLSPLFLGVTIPEFADIDYADEPSALDYNAKDAWATAALLTQQLPEIEKRGLLPIYEKELKFSLVLRKMELAGMPLAESRVQEMRVTLETEVQEAGEFLEAMELFADPWNDTEFAAWFWKGREHKAKRTKKSKELSCSQEDLLKVRNKVDPGEWKYMNMLPEQEEVVLARIKGASAKKFIATYLDNWQGQAEDGVIWVYPSFNQTGTMSWRLSSSKPNVQNVPKRGAGGRLYHLFVAPDGFVFVSADYDRLELVGMANRSKDANLMQVFRDGRDLHDERVKKLLPWFALKGINRMEDMRRYAKVINFGIPYGLTGYGAADRLSLTQDEGDLLVSSFFEDYPGIGKEQKKNFQFAKRHGYVETFLGRPMYIPGIYAEKGIVAHHAQNQAWSYPPQGDGMEIVKDGMILLDEELLPNYPDSKQICQVHDELLFVVREEQALAFADELQVLMTDTRHELPYTAVPHIGKTWGEIKDTENPFHTGDDDATGV